MVSSESKQPNGQGPRQSRWRRWCSAALTRVRHWIRWLWEQEGSPAQRARGLAAGVFCGCFPFFGLQTLLGVALASLVRGNHLLAAAGTWISNPFTYVPLFWFNYQLGTWLLGPGHGWPSMAILKQHGFWELGWSFTSRLILGSTIVGASSASVVGLTYWRWMLRQPPPKPGQSIRSM
ncbi:DUF2062 domain-containing protein [Synechococcus sp. CS-205]|jgi:uncharacterized protein (DUF2062 family)|uniref:DUF2062 domain-containing protein n=1 Tax=Synechococcus sp. CS-205 TaxID=2847984 RepID=UPI00223C1501|nr:DUF2062 domain-containing protein [Synechococcus sp. CS-205]MCT0248017.1 DUF2062 domain-containing protein [Synechococcus sp. CS-205]